MAQIDEQPRTPASGALAGRFGMRIEDPDRRRPEERSGRRGHAFFRAL
jgi:hypothetical protein